MFRPNEVASLFFGCIAAVTIASEGKGRGAVASVTLSVDWTGLFPERRRPFDKPAPSPHY